MECSTYQSTPDTDLGKQEIILQLLRKNEPAAVYR